MRRETLYKNRLEYLNLHLPYKMTYFKNFDFSVLKNILWSKRAGRGSNATYNDAIIMADTETSKKDRSGIHENHVVAWTVSIRAFDRNLVTLWGRKPSDLADTLARICDSMEGENTFVYFHNLSYDWVFIRRFLFKKIGTPTKQLNTKPHYPIYIEFSNGLILRDSLILAQRKLEKWAKDMNVEHQKAVGKWDYDKLRGQKERYNRDEKEYIEHDTLAGVECLAATMKALNKHIYSMPYTATGIPREQVRTRGREENAHNWFLRLVPTWEQFLILQYVYHGGYTHGNRHFVSEVIKEKKHGLIEGGDFTSSYPFVMLSEKYPAERFRSRPDCALNYIVENSENYAYMFKLVLYNFRLKDDFTAMPALQFSKCVKSVNLVTDNGRVLCGKYAEIYLTEQDACIIAEQYTFEKHLCREVQVAVKDYLPRWITDYVFELFRDKQFLKGGDPVSYAIAKAKLNSIYGLFAQKPVRDTINEDYETGDYIPEYKDLEAEYEKYCKRVGSVLPYQIGVWVTAYAMRNLFTLGKCIDYDHGGYWLYSDTDSIYSNKWNKDKVAEYNERCKEKLRANNYGPVQIGAKEYWLGVVSFDAENVYTEFKYCGAKRYCGRSKEDGQLHITVAGVPKKGADCLQDDIKNFAEGFIFSGTQTGKQQHTYFYNDIYIDENGNETGDSIDLSPCDYMLDSVYDIEWEKIFEEEIEVQVYEE